MTFISTGFPNFVLQQLSVFSLELALTQVCECFPQTKHLLKVIDGQILLYLYCCKDLSYSRLWCSSSVTLSISFHLISAPVPGKLAPYSFQGPNCFTLEENYKVIAASAFCPLLLLSYHFVSAITATRLIPTIILSF